MNWLRRHTFGLILAIAFAAPASANVIGDWNEKAVSLASALGWGPLQTERLLATMHLAIFDAVNAVERRYHPYLIEVASPVVASQEAAAASAAGNVLAGFNPATAVEVQQSLASYVGRIPDNAEKQAGLALGEAAAARMLERHGTLSREPDADARLRAPGVHVATTSGVSGEWRRVKPFVLRSADQFRPGPPVALSSEEWAANYSEIKELGRRNSMQRSARQSEDALLWHLVDLSIQYAVVRGVAAARELTVVDSARLFALVASVRADTLIAVLDAKYHYNFWRPVTAIRNGDIDGNPTTERDVGWLPLETTPPCPEYPCAFCAVSAGIGGVLEALFATPYIAKVALSSPTLPGVVRHWTNIRVLQQQAAEARIYAGLNYRFSTTVGEQMGRKIGHYAAENLLQPIEGQGGGGEG
jgi:hypothetical protein